MISQLSVYIYSSLLLIHYTSFYTSFCPTAFLCRGTWFPVWNLRWRQWRKGPKKGRPTQPEAALLSWGTRMLRHLRWIKTMKTKRRRVSSSFSSSWSLSISSVSASAFCVAVDETVEWHPGWSWIAFGDGRKVNWRWLEVLESCIHLLKSMFLTIKFE